MVAVGIGVSPQVEFLQGSGIAIDDGIMVDSHLQTNQAFFLPETSAISSTQARMMITRIVREGAENEVSSKDYAFSRRSIEQHKRDGYKMAKEALGRCSRAT